MNTLKIFSNKEFGDIRAVSIDGEPWLVGKDVAAALRFARTADAVRQHVAPEDRGVGEIQTPGGVQQMTIINESGLYSMIFGSKLESAKHFKRWVTSEVLPAIRKTGGYQMQAPKGKELLALAVIEAQKTIEQQTAQIEQMKPHAVLGRAITTANTSILVGDLAKILRQNGVDIGAQRLFSWMRDNGYLVKRKGADWNMPTQRSMEMKLFEIKESVHIDGNGCNRISRTPKVTGKGQEYFVNKLLTSPKEEVQG